MSYGQMVARDKSRDMDSLGPLFVARAGMGAAQGPQRAAIWTGEEGVAGFIKAVLMLSHRRLVPSLQRLGPKAGLPWGAFRLQAKVNNLTGRTYETSYGYNQPGRAVYFTVRWQPK